MGVVPGPLRPGTSGSGDGPSAGRPRHARAGEAHPGLRLRIRHRGWNARPAAARPAGRPPRLRRRGPGGGGRERAGGAYDPRRRTLRRARALRPDREQSSLPPGQGREHPDRRGPDLRGAGASHPSWLPGPRGPEAAPGGAAPRSRLLRRGRSRRRRTLPGLVGRARVVPVREGRALSSSVRSRPPWDRPGDRSPRTGAGRARCGIRH